MKDQKAEYDITVYGRRKEYTIEMQRVMISRENLTESTILLKQEEGSYRLRLSKHGSGIFFPQLMDCREHLLTFLAKVQEEHSLSMHLLFYVHKEEAPVLEIRFGLLPGVKTRVCIDLSWLDARELFPEMMPGTLKIVCHGRRIEREEISGVVLSSLASFHDVQIELEDVLLTDEYPVQEELPDVKLVDCFGQAKGKSWNGKIRDLEELRKKLWRQYEDGDIGYPFEDWSAYGG